MKRNIWKICVTLGLSFALAGCQNVSVNIDNTEAESTTVAESASQTQADTQAETDTTYKIGVLQLVQHPALDLSNEGFVAALDASGISYTIDQQNAGGEQSSAQTIAEKLVNDGDDLIFAIATPAAQAVAGLTTEIPIVITAVTDPEASGLVDSNSVPGGNVTGSSDLTPIKEQMDLLHKILPEAKTVGILYSSSEANSKIQAELAHEALEALGISYKDYTVSGSNEIQTVVESMIGKVDVIYTPTDNVIAAGMSTVAMIATENGIPIIGGESAHVDNGALATYSIDYYEIGYVAGEMAVEILTKGADPATMPIAYLTEEQFEISVNEEVAQTLGIDLSVVSP